MIPRILSMIPVRENSEVVISDPDQIAILQSGRFPFPSELDIAAHSSRDLPGRWSNGRALSSKPWETP